MNIEELLLFILKKETELKKGLESIFIQNKKITIKIMLSNKINEIKIYLKKNLEIKELKFNSEEKYKILMLLFFINRTILKISIEKDMFLKIEQMYKLKNFKIIEVNKYLDILESLKKIRKKKEYSEYSKKFKLIYKEIDFEEKKEINENKKEELTKEQLKEIINLILLSNQIVKESTKIKIYYKEDIVIYDLKKEKNIIKNEVEYNTEEEIYIKKALIIKNINIFKNLIKIENINCSLKEIDEKYEYYENKNLKTKIIIKKNKKEKEKKEIIGTNNKNSLIEKEDIFKTENFGTIGELLGKEKTEIKDSFEITENLIPYFKEKINKDKEKKETKTESLVLWDVENIHYYNDFSIISRYVKNENQLKIMSFNEKYRTYESINRLNFILNKLKKRKWIIKETKKIADNILIEEFHKYKNQIKELIIISNDSDFKEIIEEANKLNINTIVLFRHGRNKNNYWYDIAKEKISLKEMGEKNEKI
jgi:hypothetical protein